MKKEYNNITEEEKLIDVRIITLLKVVEMGSYTKAADVLSLSQPAVSQHIRQIESSLGVQIFDHSHNRLQLTHEGEIVVHFARSMVALQRNLEQTLKSEREQIHSLTVGITHTAESSAIINALASYVNRFDKLSLKIITNTSSNLYAMLRNFELDFAFVEGRVNDPALGCMMLDTDCLVLAVPPDHTLAGQGTVTIDQLKKEKLILRLPNSNTRNLLVASLESQNLSINDFNIVMEIDSIATIKDLIRGGFGVSVLAKSACMSELRRGRLSLLTIENFSMMREINIVYLKNYEHLDLLRGIVETYRDRQK